MLKIGYFGDGEWAHNALEKLLNDDTISIEFITVRYDSKDPVLLDMAHKYEIPVEISGNINSKEFVDRMKNYGIDLFVSMSFNQIFKEEMINLPKYKTINCHAGKLPFYRGRNILNWALINDEKEFGITVHFMDKGIDTGDIILQDVYPITDEDDYGTLLEKAYVECAEILYRAIKNIQIGDVKTIKQDSIDKVGLYCGQRFPGDEFINWEWESRRIFNFVRALTRPGVGASSYLNEKLIKIYKVEMIEGAHSYINTPGQILMKEKDVLYVKTGDTMLRIIDYEYDGKIMVGMRFK